MPDLPTDNPADARAPQDNERIILAHGGGGELTRRLLAEHIIPKLANSLLDPLTDGAILPKLSGRACLTTDAFVVMPLEFPGGDIGRLAVCGTVNDLAVMGAQPKALSLALIMEEGLEIRTLDRIVDSIAAAAAEAHVVVATGDTKVVEHSGAGGLTITTAGVGDLPDGVELGTGRIRPGDAILITGRIAEHGLAVMSARKGLAFQTELVSDVAPLAGLAGCLLSAAPAAPDQPDAVRFLRDPTRGGLAGVLADLAEETGLDVEVAEDDVPISATALHASEMLGLDPLTVANEGKIVAVVAADRAEELLAACRRHPLGLRGAIIGRFGAEASAYGGLAELVTRAGGRRVIQRPYGEELPRIC